MNKILKVVKPFFEVNEGDTFALTENGTYINEITKTFEDCNEDVDFSSKLTSTYEISSNLAEKLVKDGYLASTDKKFVNIFDEIDALINSYTDDLNNINEDLKDAPACLKIEKETVLNNLIKVLTHLGSLKK